LRNQPSTTRLTLAAILPVQYKYPLRECRFGSMATIYVKAGKRGAALQTTLEISRLWGDLRDQIDTILDNFDPNDEEEPGHSQETAVLNETYH
jgi:hypothetical protein